MSTSTEDSRNLLGQLLRDESPLPSAAKIDFATSDKVTILLSILDTNTQTVQRREDREQKMFEWSTSLMLAAFAAVVALSGRTTPLPSSTPIKVIASILIAIPTGLFIYRINTSARGFLNSARVVDRVEAALRLFDEGYYSEDSIYPQQWSGALSKKVLHRKTPRYYTAILILMLVCVIASIWLLL